MIDILSRLKAAITGKQEPAGLICPRCERSLEGHDAADCARKMSRRFFFGVVAAAVIVPKDPILTAIEQGMKDLFNPVAPIHKQFGKSRWKIGDTMMVRRPIKFIVRDNLFYEPLVEQADLLTLVNPEMVDLANRDKFDDQRDYACAVGTGFLKI